MRFTRVAQTRLMIILHALLMVTLHHTYTHCIIHTTQPTCVGHYQEASYRLRGDICRYQTVLTSIAHTCTLKCLSFYTTCLYTYNMNESKFCSILSDKSNEWINDLDNKTLKSKKYYYKIVSTLSHGIFD